MSTWYKVWLGSIHLVEVCADTEKQVILPNGRRELKRTDNSGYFRTAEEAKADLISRAEAKVREMETYLKYYQRELDNAREYCANFKP